MCIAIIKERGATMPNEDVLDICWYNNPDGAGFMYEKDGKLVIDKGYMRKDHLLKGLRNREFGIDDFVVIHFRKSTSAGVNPENTHPFPISGNRNNLHALDVKCTKAIIHNGVVGTGSKNLSDTAIFVKECLADPIIINNLNNEKLQNLIESAVDGSRFYIADIENNIFMKLGTWYYEKQTGLYFSNETWRKKHTYTNNTYRTNNTTHATSSTNTSGNVMDTTIMTDGLTLIETSQRYCEVCRKVQTISEYKSGLGNVWRYCNVCKFYIPNLTTINDKAKLPKVIHRESYYNNASSEVIQEAMTIERARKVLDKKDPENEFGNVY